MVDAFYEQNCAMLVGSYTMTNGDMEVIAPGLIHHKEWTPDNGRGRKYKVAVVDEAEKAKKLLYWLLASHE